MAVDQGTPSQMATAHLPAPAGTHFDVWEGLCKLKWFGEGRWVEVLYFLLDREGSIRLYCSLEVAPFEHRTEVSSATEVSI